MQRLLQVVSARFLAAQLHDLAYHSAAIHFDHLNAKGNDLFFMLRMAVRRDSRLLQRADGFRKMSVPVIEGRLTEAEARREPSA